MVANQFGLKPSFYLRILGTNILGKWPCGCFCGGIAAMPDVETIFYDGHCGLCHGFVRFVAHRDCAGNFEFAPLQGQRFAQLIPWEQQAGIPDSVVVHSRAHPILVRSAAVRHVLRRLGGFWSLLAAAAGVLPVAFLDSLYDAVARIRRKMFGSPPDVCPLVPPELRARFRA